MKLQILIRRAIVALLLPSWAQAQVNPPFDQSGSPAGVRTASAGAFNAAMGVILNGTYGRLSQDPATYVLPGFALGPDTGPGERGFSLGESEINLNANIDDKFFGNLTFTLMPDNTVSVEEAFIRTIGLQEGLTLKAGRFLSGIGYLNEQHAHVWDFVDAPLPYRAMLANQLGEDGIQLRWLAPIESFLMEFGAEALRGDSFPAGGAAKKGNGTQSFFVHIGGDAGVSNSWRAGLSRLNARAVNRETGDPAALDSFTGKNDLNIADFVWKWAPNGNSTITNFKFQAEYFQGTEKGSFTSNTLATDDIDRKQSGWYAQAVYQFMPRWRAGVRHDEVKADAVSAALQGTVLDPMGHKPKRESAMIDFSNSEFSRVRLQYNRDQSRPDVVDNQVFLQYIMSIGAHGAHQF